MSKSLHTNAALLLPKLQSYFAEFLSEGFLARLSFLNLSTCVGLRYGQYFMSLEAFLGSMASICLQNVSASTTPQINERTDLPIHSSYMQQGTIPTVPQT